MSGNQKLGGRREGEAPKGFGAIDTTFSFQAHLSPTEMGYYPFGHSVNKLPSGHPV